MSNPNFYLINFQGQKKEENRSPLATHQTTDRQTDGRRKQPRAYKTRRTNQDVQNQVKPN